MNCPSPIPECPVCHTPADKVRNRYLNQCVCKRTVTFEGAIIKRGIDWIDKVALLPEKVADKRLAQLVEAMSATIGYTVEEQNAMTDEEWVAALNDSEGAITKLFEESLK